jgi:glycosyltransferase involved in cell wall biosynthesis
MNAALSLYQIFGKKDEQMKDNAPRAPLISVIIPHLNQPENLEACLSSLEGQTLQRSHFEIIVVDNGSSCLPKIIVARHAGVRLLYEKTPGPGPARNLGALHARAPILCFIDADCRAHCEWLATVQRSLAAAPTMTILGGNVLIWRDDKSKYTPIELYESLFSYRNKLHIERHGFSGTGNLAVRKMDFDVVGPFGGIFMPEDKDWGHRAVAAGFRFKYIPEMIVYHPARQSFRSLCVQWDREVRHALTEARRKRTTWRIYWGARAFVVLCSPLVHGLLVIGDTRTDISCRMKALEVLFGIRIFRAWKMAAFLLSPAKGVLWNRDALVGIDETN